MINFKKGPALSLHQINYIGKAVSGQAVVAGMVVRLNNNSGTVEVLKGSSDSSPDLNAIYGFAINNQDAGDVIESGVIGVYALDGASVIETDQAAATINYTNYPIGSLLTTNTSGQVVKASDQTSLTAVKIIGQVEGIRTIPGNVQSLTDNNGNAFKVQGTTTVLGVKLAS
jgi:hypothetical protein